MIVHVYILQMCNQKYYTGISQNLEKRFKEHMSGLSKSTRKFLPVKLVWHIECVGYRQAHRVELRIKGMGAEKWLSLEKSNDIYRRISKTQQKNNKRSFSK